MKFFRTCIAFIATILFFPVAILLCLGIGIMSLPEILIDCFMEVRGK